VVSIEKDVMLFYWYTRLKLVTKIKEILSLLY